MEKICSENNKEENHSHAKGVVDDVGCNMRKIVQQNLMSKSKMQIFHYVKDIYDLAFRVSQITNLSYIIKKKKKLKK